MQLTNNTNNTFYSHGYLCTGSWPSTTVQLIVWLLILVFSLTGNVLIIAIFFRDKTLRTTVNYFIVNMCVSDLIFPIIIIPIWVILDQGKSCLFVAEIYAALCKIFSIALGVSVHVSLFSMTALAADRFRAIIFPMKPALFSPNKCCATITAMWLSSFAMFLYHAIVSSPGNDSCVDTKSTSKELIFVSAFFALICLFAVTITVFYLKVAIFLHRQKNSLHLASEVVKKRAKRNRKIITMLIIIVILFYVGWIPFFVMMFNSSAKLPCVYVWLAAYILPVLNPVANPVVYFVFNEKYLQGFMEILSYLHVIAY